MRNGVQLDKKEEKGMDEGNRKKFEEEYETFEAELLIGDHEDVDFKKANDFYETLREKITNWAQDKGGEKGKKAAEIILLAPDLFMLLIRMLQDSRVPAQQKAWIGMGIAYFISPIDLMPEGLLGPIGYLDDIALAAYVINKILNSHKDIVLENWSGQGDILTVIQDILAQAESLIGERINMQLQRFFNKKST